MPRRFLLNETDGLLPHAIAIVDGIAVPHQGAAIAGKNAAVRVLVMSPMMVGG